MNNKDFEEKVRIQQEADRRERKKRAEDAANLALLLGTQSSNPRIASFCRNILKGKAIGMVMMVIMVVALVVGGLHHVPWVFTLSVAGCCIWFHFCCGKEFRTIAYLLDVMLILFWAFMRFVVMPCCW